MDDDIKVIAVTVVLVAALVTIVTFIYLGTTNATNRVNTRLDHIGTACAKARNTWLNNNCIPQSHPNASP